MRRPSQTIRTTVSSILRADNQKRSYGPIVAASVASLGVLAGQAHAAPPPRPSLPTPCLAGNCGSSVQSFVSYGAAGAAVSGTQLTVTQSTNNAILNWADFNIANGHSVTFVQPSATAAALNKIYSADPSVI